MLQWRRFFDSKEKLVREVEEEDHSEEENADGKPQGKRDNEAELNDNDEQLETKENDEETGERI